MVVWGRLLRPYMDESQGLLRIISAKCSLSVNFCYAQDGQAKEFLFGFRKTDS